MARKTLPLGKYYLLEMEMQIKEKYIEAAILQKQKNRLYICLMVVSRLKKINNSVGSSWHRQKLRVNLQKKKKEKETKHT